MNNDLRKIVSVSFFFGGFLLTEWLVSNRRSTSGDLLKRVLPATIVGGICWIAYPYLAKRWKA